MTTGYQDHFPEMSDEEFGAWLIALIPEGSGEHPADYVYETIYARYPVAASLNNARRFLMKRDFAASAPDTFDPMEMSKRVVDERPDTAATRQALRLAIQEQFGVRLPLL